MLDLIMTMQVGRIAAAQLPVRMDALSYISRIARSNQPTLLLDVMVLIVLFAVVSLGKITLP